MRQFEIVLFAIFIAMLFAANTFIKSRNEESKAKLFKGLLWSFLVSTIALIFMGAMTVSTRSGMAFPDWPTSDGVLWPSWNYFTAQEDRFYEHGHRLLGQFVGYLAIVVLIFSRFFLRFFS